MGPDPIPEGVIIEHTVLAPHRIDANGKIYYLINDFMTYTPDYDERSPYYRSIEGIVEDIKEHCPEDQCEYFLNAFAKHEAWLQEQIFD